MSTLSKAESTKLSGVIRQLWAAGLLVAVLNLAACGSADERADNYIKQGTELEAKGDLLKAANEFRNALRIKKNLVEGWKGLARIEEKNQNWGGLVPILRTIVEYEPDNRDARIKLARLLLIGGAPQEALSAVTPLAERDDATASTIALRAAVLFSLKDQEGAIREARRALGREPDNVDAAVVLASAQLQNRSFADALKTLAAAKVSPETEAGLLVLKAQIYESAGDKEQVIAQLRALVAKFPNIRQYRDQLTRYYILQGRDNEAESELRSQVAADPNNERLFLEFVSFMAARRGNDAAKRELASRIAKGGDVYTFRVALAELQLATGEVAPATQALNDLIRNTPDLNLRKKAELTLAAYELSRHDYPKTEDLIGPVLKRDPNDTEALRLRAIVRIEQQRPADAIVDLRQALRNEPQSAQLLGLLGLAFEKSQSFELAGKQYADAMRASQFAAGPTLRYAGFLEGRGELSLADDALSEAASRNTRDLQIWTALGNVKLRRQDWIAAQEVASKIKQLGSGAGAADQIRGEALSGQNRTDESVAALKASLEASPTSVSPIVSIVRTYLRARRPDEAEGFLRNILSANPQNSAASVMLALVKSSENQSDQAFAILRDAIKRKPEDPAPYITLAQLLIRANDIDGASAALRDGLAKQPKNFALLFLQASADEQKQDFDAAISDYDALLKQFPETPIVVNNLANLLVSVKSDQASLDRAAALTAPLRRSDIAQFKDTVGWIDYRRGDLKSAVTLLEAAASGLPDNAEVHYHLGKAYQGAGRAEQAQEALKKAAELAGNDKRLRALIETARRAS